MALAMASLVLVASSTVLLRVMISPLVTTLLEVRASVRSPGSMPSSSDTVVEKEKISNVSNENGY